MWLPQSRQLFFVSNRLTNAEGEPEVYLYLLDMAGPYELRRLEASPPVLMANGGTPYGGTKVLVTSQVCCPVGAAASTVTSRSQSPPCSA